MGMMDGGKQERHKRACARLKGEWWLRKGVAPALSLIRQRLMVS